MAIGVVLVARFAANAAGPKGDDDVDLAVDPLGRKPRKAIPTSIGPPMGRHEVSAFDVTDFAECVTELVRAAIPSAAMIGVYPCGPTDTFTLLRPRGHGHAATTPPTSVVDSRRVLIRSPGRRWLAGPARCSGRCFRRFQLMTNWTGRFQHW